MNNSAVPDRYSVFEHRCDISETSSTYLRFPPSFSVWTAVGAMSARPSPAGTDHNDRKLLSVTQARPPTVSGSHHGPQPSSLHCLLPQAPAHHRLLVLAARRVRYNQAAVCCNACGGWFHRGCLHMSPSQYRKLDTSRDPWFCLVCSLPPFSDDFIDVPVASDFLSHRIRRPRCVVAVQVSRH